MIFLQVSRSTKRFLTRIQSDGYQCFAFDIIIRHMVGGKMFKNIFIDDVPNKWSIFFFQQWEIISETRLRWSRLDGKLREETRDICRQSLSRQMSDNTIVWWVWMTGSFVSLLSSSFIFSFFSSLLLAFFARLVRKVTTVSQYSFASRWRWEMFEWCEMSQVLNFFWYFTRKIVRRFERQKSKICHVESDDCWTKKTMSKGKQLEFSSGSSNVWVKKVVSKFNWKKLVENYVEISVAKDSHRTACLFWNL